jgi:uncharacterized Zn finger protein
MSRQYNAMVIDWICCPDCGCNVMRAEGLTPTGAPTGSIECTCCGFAAADVQTVTALRDWSLMCERIGHSWMDLTTFRDGKTLRVCAFCGKHEVR